jgi:hypothetical protein
MNILATQETNQITVNVNQVGLPGAKGNPGDVYTPKKGSCFFDGNLLETDIVTSGVYQDITGTKQLLVNSDFILEGNELKYVGENTAWFLIIGSVCFSSTSQNVTFRARLSVNDITIPRSCSRATVTGTPFSGRAESLHPNALIELQPNDLVDIKIANFTNADNLTVANLELIAVQA